MPINQNVLGVLNGPTNIIATAGTAVVAMLPPWSGSGYQKLQQKVNVPQGGGLARVEGGQGILHVTKLALCNLTTLQDLIVVRPKNWTYFTADFAKNTTVVPNTTLKDDPGLYATTGTYRYNNGTAPATSDNAIATGDYVAYQLADGTWCLDTVASGTYGSTLTLTTGTPNFTNGKVLSGSPLYFFGIQTDVDPAEGNRLSFGVSSWKPGWQARASVNTANDLTILENNGFGLFSAYNAGDPVLVYCANATTAITGFYATGFYSSN